MSQSKDSLKTKALLERHARASDAIQSEAAGRPRDLDKRKRKYGTRIA